MDFSKKSYRVSLTAMFIALSLIFLYLAAIVPTGNAALYFISSLFVSGMIVERQPALACLVFAATSLLGLLIVPNLLMVLPYVMLFGHYGIGKYFLEKIRSKLISYLSKLLYFNIGIGLIYFFAYNAFFQGVLSQIPFWLLIIFIQLVFVLFDFVYSKILLWYFHTIRKRIVK